MNLIATDRAVVSVVRELLIADRLRKATKFVRRDFTVKATRRHRRSTRQTEFVLTIGKPNFAERKFIRLAEDADESFPIRKVQVREWPNRRKSRGNGR